MAIVVHSALGLHKHKDVAGVLSADETQWSCWSVQWCCVDIAMQPSYL